MLFRNENARAVFRAFRPQQVKPLLPVVADINVASTGDLNKARICDVKTSGHGRVIVANIAWVLVSIFGVPSCRATLVVTSCMPGRIVMGADGLSQRPADFILTAQSCKIRQGASDCFSAVIGLDHFDAYAGKSTSSYDLFSAAANACKGKGTIAERAIAFQRNYLEYVQGAMDFFRKIDPATYRNYRDDDGIFRIEVVFAGSSPLSIVDVAFADDGNGKFHTEEPIINTPPSCQSQIRPVGVTDRMQLYARYHPEIKSMSDIDLVRSLLNGAIQLETNPPRIGQPIAELAIDANGPRWIEQGKCEDIKTKAKASKKTNSHR